MAHKKHAGILAVAEEQAVEELEAIKDCCCGPTNASCCSHRFDVRIFTADLAIAYRGNF